MKKRFFFALMAVFALTMANAQECTKNVVDCEGICGRMTDTDSDLICDLSPRSQQQKTELEAEKTKVADPEKQAPAKQEKESDGFGDLSETPAIDTAASDTAASASEDEWFGAESAPQAPAEDIEKKTGSVYPLVEVGGGTLLFYMLTYLLVKFKVFKTSTHRKIWNSVLLTTFIVSGLLGLVLVFQVNYNILGDWYSSFLDLHVEFGIAMAIVSIFHITWHLKYFGTILKTKKSKS